MHDALKVYNINISSIRCTFLGRPVAQSFTVLFLFEKVLLENPFKRIIELGTWKGNLSLYFLLYCISENAEFYTYDTRVLNSYTDDKHDVLKEILNFKKYFEVCDIFKNEATIGNILKKEGRTVLLCDNGHKKQEFNIFAKYLKVGDIISVHDWDIEIRLDDIRETIKKQKLEMIFEEECIMYDTNIRFFQKMS